MDDKQLEELNKELQKSFSHFVLLGTDGIPNETGGLDCVYIHHGNMKIMKEMAKDCVESLDIDIDFSLL